MSRHRHHRHPQPEHHVAEPLVPLYRRLSDAEHSLQEWHDMGHQPTKAQLCDVQKSLSEVDQHYVEGAFKVDGAVPEGQAIMAFKLHRARSLLHEFESEL